MTRTIFLSCTLFTLAALAACSVEPAASSPKTPAPAPAPVVAPAVAVTPAARATYGQVGEGPTVSPSDVLAKIDEYDGKLVRVAGTVAAVCLNRGCWMDVAAANGDTIRVKVKDGEVVFPPSAVGKQVIAEGTVVKIPADPADDPAVTAACAGEAHTEGHEECVRPAGARARLDGRGAVVML